MLGQSNTSMTMGNVFGLVGQFIPIVLGLVAEQFDLRVDSDGKDPAQRACTALWPDVGPAPASAGILYESDPSYETS
jgi:hypothetical protein